MLTLDKYLEIKNTILKDNKVCIRGTQIKVLPNLIEHGFSKRNIERCYSAYCNTTRSDIGYVVDDLVIQGVLYFDGKHTVDKRSGERLDVLRLDPEKAKRGDGMAIIEHMRILKAMQESPHALYHP